MKDKKMKSIEKKSSKEKKGKKSLWTFFWLLAAIILVGIYFGWNFFQTPVSGEIKVGKVVENEQANKITFERYESKYFSFHYDQKYVLKNSSKEPQPSGNILETAFFSQSENNSKKIALTVESLEDRQIGDVGNFIMRNKNSELYLKQKKSIQNVESFVFTSTRDGLFEKVFFIPSKSHLITLAFTSTDDKVEEFEAEISDIIGSLQFK
jgi:hypothetical protein